jgi:hypothetical protein
MNFRILLATLFLTLTALSGSAQEYTLIRFKGVFYRKGMPLSVGSKVGINDTIRASSNKDVAVFVEKKGQPFIVTKAKKRPFMFKGLKPGDPQSDPIYWEKFKNGLTYIQDLKTFFGKQELILFDNSVKVKVNAKYFPMTSSNYFYVQFKYGKETIGKKLIVKRDSLILLQSEIFKVDKKAIPESAAKDLRIRYYSTSEARDLKLGKLKFVKANESAMSQILETYVQFAKDNNHKPIDIMRNSIILLKEFDGKMPPPYNMMVWLHRKYDLPIK